MILASKADAQQKFTELQSNALIIVDGSFVKTALFCSHEKPGLGI